MFQSRAWRAASFNCPGSRGPAVDQARWSSQTGLAFLAFLCRWLLHARELVACAATNLFALLSHAFYLFFFFPPPLGRATMASSVRSVDPVPLEDRRNSFRSRSPSRSRSPTPRSDYSRSPSMDRRRYDDRDSRGRSPPRNGRYRSRSRGRSFSRSVSRSRSRSRSRSYSRGRSWSRGRSRSWSRTRSATPPMRSTKASETPQSACLCVFVCGGPWLTGIAM